MSETMTTLRWALDRWFDLRIAARRALYGPALYGNWYQPKTS